MSRILERVNGVARCPYDPRHNSTAVVTDSGELYAATVIDFSGRDPVIYRSLGNMPPLRTAQYNSKWLNGKRNTMSCLNSVLHSPSTCLISKCKKKIVSNNFSISTWWICGESHVSGVFTCYLLESRQVLKLTYKAASSFCLRWNRSALCQAVV